MGLLSGSDPIVAYDIDLGMHVVFCHGPCDELQELKYGDRVVWTGASTGGRITIDAREVFGDDGGMGGDVDVLMGEPTQAQNDYLLTHLSADIPAFRGVTSLVFRQTYWGRSPYLPRLSGKWKRTSIQTGGDAQWYPEKADISGDMNPAHILRECIINAEWGLGWPTSQIDDANFRTLADTLHAEGFGLSFLWTNEEEIEYFIERVEKHISGRINVNPRTGLFVGMLIRDGYDTGSLYVADPSNIKELQKFERRGWGDAINELTVIFRDRATNKDIPVTVQDIGNIGVQGRVVPATRHFPGISNEALAKRVAQRELKILSAGLAHAKFVVDRTAWEGIPGDPFKLTWPKLGIEEVVFRVVNIDTGTLEDGRIIVDVVEDYFGLPGGTYLGQEPTGWVSPHTEPVVAPNEQTKEATHWEVWKYASAADIATWGSDFGFAVVHATKASGDSLSYEVWSRVGAAAFEYQTKGEFAPTAELSSAIGPATGGLTSAVIDVEAVDGIDKVELDTYAWIEDEALAVRAIDEGAGTITVDRGVMDSVPVPHLANAQIWFADNHLGIDDDLHQSPVTVDLKALPQTSLGTLPIGDAATLQQSINWRYHRPYPPGNFKINTVAYPTAPIAEDAALAVSWAHRDRTQQTDALHTQTEADIGPENGTTYTIRVYGELDTLVHTETGIAGTNWTYPTADEIVESGLPGGGSGDPYDDVINAESPTLYWRVGESGGVTAADETTNHPGTYVGTPTLGEPGLLAGDPDTCVKLNGTSQYVTWANHADFNVQKFAASLVVDVIAIAGYQHQLFHFGDNASGGNEGYAWAIQPTGKLTFGTYDAGWRGIETSAVHIEAGKEYHLGINADGTSGDGEIEFYVNGKLVETIPFDYTLAGTNSTGKLGALKGTGIQNYFDGWMDEFAYFSGVNLLPIEFAKQYSAAAGAGRLNGALRVQLESVRGGLTSHQYQEHAFERTGWGAELTDEDDEDLLDETGEVLLEED